MITTTVEIQEENTKNRGVTTEKGPNLDGIIVGFLTVHQRVCELVYLLAWLNRGRLHTI